MRFFFHYNKPASLKSGCPVITVHIKKTCRLVTDLVVKVPTRARFRKTQPRFVMTGKANTFRIENGVAYLE